MSILITENLSKTYGSGPTAVEALKPAGIRVEAGEFVAVAGASGSGKSTLLHLLGGLETPVAAGSSSTAATFTASKRKSWPYCAVAKSGLSSSSITSSRY
jgi:ABC-type lipoprotein export system ATPase subunit